MTTFFTVISSFDFPWVKLCVSFLISGRSHCHCLGRAPFAALKGFSRGRGAGRHTDIAVGAAAGSGAAHGSGPSGRGRTQGFGGATVYPRLSGPVELLGLHHLKQGRVFFLLNRQNLDLAVRFFKLMAFERKCAKDR